ncbi:MAG: hypothetical protein VW987_03140, partial [Alphaproteobacteria bacterium]
LSEIHPDLQKPNYNFILSIHPIIIFALYFLGLLPFIFNERRVDRWSDSFTPSKMHGAAHANACLG